MEKKDRILDLTHTLKEGIPLWDDTCLYKITEKKGEGHFRLLQVTMDLGTGTHIDAPYHFIPDGIKIDEIPLDKLMVSCKTVHIPNADANFILTAEDLRKCEAKSGPIHEGQFVLIHTGWDRFWNDPEKYINRHKFPSISIEAAKYLVQKKIVGIGVDTLSPDLPDSEFPVHSILLRNNIYIVENIAQADKMPPNGHVMIFPLKGAGLAEAPVRMIGTWN